MAGTTTSTHSASEHVFVATSQTNRTVDQVIRLLEQSRLQTHLSPAEHFSRAVRLWEAALRHAEMDEWLELCLGMEKGMTPLAEALARLLEHAAHSFEDVIGLAYMMLDLGSVRSGQYFTPFHIAQMIARISLRDFQPPAPGKGPIRFSDPCCGSGVMHLAMMEALEEQFPGMLDSGEVVFSGQDIDATCVSMCRLNFRLRGIPRAVRPLAASIGGDQDTQQQASVTDLIAHDDTSVNVVHTLQYVFF
jgi:type I restriction-modification system DNA methylase subunit